ncbi:transient-receptor-potential-like protein [Acanthaster planci]|uniref:Transient-receptor-potential-like protein n=1 Tax=Acanthaster planci TaxID=133434 RepID=A0A8B7XJ89_ACAPL|nr:transient-receptor-potential-like protein [Acanthaster planci]
MEEHISPNSHLVEPLSVSRRGSLCRSFLDSIKRNDVDAVRSLAGENKPEDPLACDELGRTALVVAIDKHSYDVIKCLLELQYDIGDALFHAVNIQNATAVRTICKSLPESCKLDAINEFPSGNHYPAVTTPLLLAGRTNNFEIIKVLLKHGATMPDLNDLIRRAKSDPYLRFLAALYWYEAASSEAYILLTSDDPLDTIFRLGRSLQEAEEALNVPLFNIESERIQGKLVDLSTKLLSLARDNDEIGVLLRGGEKGTPSPQVPLRIQQALDMDSFKQFVCHPSSQAYMCAQWEIHHPRWFSKKPQLVRSYLFNIAVVLLYPVLCVAYILFPQTTSPIMKRPKIRFLIHAGSRLTLLAILIVSTRSQWVEEVVSEDNSKASNRELLRLYILYSEHRLSLVNAFTVMWILGMTVRAVKQLWTQGAPFYFKNGWNIMDFLQLILYWIFLIAAFVAFVKSLVVAEAGGILESHGDVEQAPSNVVNLSTRTYLPTTESTSRVSIPYGAVEAPANGSHRVWHGWQEFQAQLISQGAFALANMLSFLHILHHLLAFALLGPLLVSFIGMTRDVLKFFAIFGCLLVTFSIGMTQLYHKFEALDVHFCNRDGEPCQDTPFLTFMKSMGSLFWSLFNMMDLTNLQIGKGLALTESIGLVMYASFMLIGSIVLLNALIAMMSNTYTRVEENSEVEWKVARTRIMVEYISESASLPPPFNLVPTVKFMLWLFRCLRRKCRRSSDSGSETTL